MKDMILVIKIESRPFINIMYGQDCQVEQSSNFSVNEMIQICFKCFGIMLEESHENSEIKATSINLFVQFYKSRNVDFDKHL